MLYNIFYSFIQNFQFSSEYEKFNGFRKHLQPLHPSPEIPSIALTAVTWLEPALQVTSVGFWKDSFWITNISWVNCIFILLLIYFRSDHAVGYDRSDVRGIYCLCSSSEAERGASYWSLEVRQSKVLEFSTKELSYALNFLKLPMFIFKTSCLLSRCWKLF